MLVLIALSTVIMLLRYQYSPVENNHHTKVYAKSSINKSYQYKTSAGTIISNYYLEPGWSIKIMNSNISKNGTIYYPKIEIMSKDTNWSYMVKNKIIQDIAKVSSGNSKALFGGVLLGDTNGLETKNKNSLNILGLSHIISVSGYNLTIIAAWLKKKYNKLPWHSLRIISILTAIWTFSAISGMGSAVLRATFMLTIFLILSFYYIEINILELFLISSSIMLIVSPSFFSDISWQLSSGATLGIIIFTNHIKTYLDKIISSNKLTNAIIDNISITIGANIITSLIIAIYFHSFSTLTIFSNILIVPLVPVIMLIGILAFLGAQLSTSITAYILHPIIELIDFILIKLEQLSRLSFAKISFDKNSIKFFITIWFLLMIAILIKYIHQKKNSSVARLVEQSSSFIFKMR
jgi:ComEC/Rec2-related protein